MMILVKMVDKKILLLVFRRHKVLPPMARMTRLATCVAFPLFSFSAKLLSGMLLFPLMRPLSAKLSLILRSLVGHEPLMREGGFSAKAMAAMRHELIFSPPFQGAHICWGTWGTLGEN